MSRGAPTFNDAENMESAFASAKDKRCKNLKEIPDPK